MTTWNDILAFVFGGILFLCLVWIGVHVYALVLVGWYAAKEIAKRRKGIRT